jgi:hypothetical protein
MATRSGLGLNPVFLDVGEPEPSSVHSLTRNSQMRSPIIVLRSGFTQKPLVQQLFQYRGLCPIQPPTS